jgi:hypothetical protein
MQTTILHWKTAYRTELLGPHPGLINRGENIIVCWDQVDSSVVAVRVVLAIALPVRSAPGDPGAAASKERLIG